MKPVLATTWQPRGELPRLERLAGQLCDLYQSILVTVPPDTPSEVFDPLQAIPGVEAIRVDDWRTGRHIAVFSALDAPTDAIQYADLDRLLHWIEAYPEELKQIAARIEAGGEDCLILGRTVRAWATHPRAMFETEALFNHTFSWIFNTPMDFGAGSRGLSRAAVEYLKEKSPPEAGCFALDAAWPLLLVDGGFTLGHEEVEGLEWETPDHYLSTIADDEARQQAAETADDDPAFWRQRVYVADQILRAGLAAAEQINNPRWPHR
ncbi:MAG: hypothetical protein JXJ17_03130 [Anaerolineae bacterium]|nr:hypothetical protein [Anaerolineae bacterium]